MTSHRVAHFEIPANQPERLASFYRDLFGWKVEKAPLPHMEYWVCRTGEGPGIDGGIMPRMAPEHCVTNYVTVEQMDPIVARAQQLGAKVIVPKTPVAGMGWFAVALDPDNNPFGFWQNDKDAR